MRLIGIGLAVALALGALVPSLAHAADKSPPLDKAALAQGMKEAPAAVKAAGLQCTVTQALYVGENKDPKTKVSAKFYEVACQEGLGYLVGLSSDPNTKLPVENCLESDRPGPDGKARPTACKLPGNKDRLAQVAPLLKAAGTPCTVTAARGIGSTPTATFFELLCSEGPDYLMQSAFPPDVSKPVNVIPCIEFPESDLRSCKLSTVAQQMALADKLAASSGKPCTIKDHRYIMTARDGSQYFEFSCADGKGYVIQRTVAGSVGKVIDCINAEGIGGGCTLTDTRTAKTEQAGLYTRLAHKAGFDCDVAEYAPFPSPPTVEVVELKCNNRPDGAVASFGDTNTVWDCGHSELAGFRCSFAKPDASFATLQADLTKLNKTECKVSNWRAVGVNTSKTTGWNEVACADGTQGYMIEYKLAGPTITPSMAIVCSQATGIGGGCQLPGNKKK